MKRTSEAEGRLRYDAYGPIPETHSLGEMFQVMEILRGQMKVPEELRPMSRMVDLKPVAGASDFSDIDVALLEPASPIELTFRGIALSRTIIRLKFLKLIVVLHEEKRKLATAWLREGLVGLNETVRAETAAKLVACVPGDSPNDDFIRAVILEMRSAKTDVLGGFVRMGELLDCPLGVVSYVFRYMPDGRAISWPAGFREEVLAAAQRLKLPVFDPAPLVQSFGVDAALNFDQGHYSRAFLPVAGAGLVEFAETVHRSGKENTAATA